MKAKLFVSRLLLSIYALVIRCWQALWDNFPYQSTRFICTHLAEPAPRRHQLILRKLKTRRYLHIFSALSRGDERATFDGDAVCQQITHLERWSAAVPLIISTRLRESVTEVWRLGCVKHQIDELKQTKYNPNDEAHESDLRLLWSTLMPDIQRAARITPEWELVGFQGSDPSTDFRGMGLFGLKCLLHFSRNNPTEAQECLGISKRHVHDFPFCVAGITFAADVYRWVTDGALDDLLLESTLSIETVFAVFGEIMMRFCATWTSAPHTLHDFQDIRQQVVAVATLWLKIRKFTVHVV